VLSEVEPMRCISYISSLVRYQNKKLTAAIAVHLLVLRDTLSRYSLDPTLPALVHTGLAFPSYVLAKHPISVISISSNKAVYRILNPLYQLLQKLLRTSATLQPI
jgi:hypothetical protein